jgi:hypothetical protein
MQGLALRKGKHCKDDRFKTESTVLHQWRYCVIRCCINGGIVSLGVASMEAFCRGGLRHDVLLMRCYVTQVVRHVPAM